MKKVILLSILSFSIFNFSFSKDKILLISEIENSDTIPVFLRLGEIKPATFDNNMTSFRLNQEEAGINSMQSRSASFPQNNNELLNYICDALNKHFNTTKFIAFPYEQVAYVKNKNGVAEVDLVTMNRKNIVLADISGDFGYVYKNGFKRTPDEERILISWMQFTGLLMINFLHMHEETLRPVKISSTGTFIYSGYFEVKGIYYKAEDLLDFFNPASLIERSNDPINSRVEKLAAKENKAYQKSLK